MYGNPGFLASESVADLLAGAEAKMKVRTGAKKNGLGITSFRETSRYRMEYKILGQWTKDGGGGPVLGEKTACLR